MRLIKLLTNLLLAVLLALSASATVSAKVASGPQNLGGQVHQDQIVVNALMHQGKTESSYGGMSGSSVVAKSVVDPKTIRFSQDSIKGTFRDGRSVQDLAAGLKSGSIKPGDVPAIRTVERNGQLISIDNRRLSAFREAGVPIRTRPATAQEILQAQKQGKFSAGASGSDTIRIRGQ